MPSDLTGTVTHSHDPKPPELPPLPEAILLTHLAGSDDRWMAHTCGTVARLTECAEGLTRFGWHSARIVTIQPPPSAREVSDAEVVKIMREAGIDYPNWTDSEMLHNFDLTARCVRAALKGVAHAK